MHRASSFTIDLPPPSRTLRRVSGPFRGQTF
nr:MAG TPA: hypothetical protein [Caudoviricetes sp.]